MNLGSTYHGLELKNPLIIGASPLADEIDSVKALEDAGAAGLVMRSLFVEQIEHHRTGYSYHIERHEESYAEARTYFPPLEDFALGPDQYLSHLQKVKKAVDIPVIASLNGSEEGDWYQYARMLEEAGADGLELNLYYLAADPSVRGEELENKLIQVVRGVRSRTKLPIAVKLSPFYSSIANFAAELDQAGVDGLVLFNRFYQPDIDIENLEVQPKLRLSDSSELLLRLRWIAILYGKVDVDLAVTGGVHSATDAIKAVMAGAQAIQLVSAILKNGPAVLTGILRQVEHWMEEFEYESLTEMRGSMSHIKSGDSEGFERTNYLRILQSWRAES